MVHLWDLWFCPIFLPSTFAHFALVAASSAPNLCLVTPFTSLLLLLFLPTHRVVHIVIPSLSCQSSPDLPAYSTCQDSARLPPSSPAGLTFHLTDVSLVSGDVSATQKSFDWCQVSPASCSLVVIPPHVSFHPSRTTSCWVCPWRHRVFMFSFTSLIHRWK